MSKANAFQNISKEYITEEKLICNKWQSCLGVEHTLESHSCIGGYWGDIESNVLIVAESPSYIGPHLGRYFGDKDLDSAQAEFRNFIIDKISKGATPFFTDAVKCGIGRRKKKNKLIKEGATKKEKLESRFINCKEYLEKEIDLLKPQIIVCAGNWAYNKVNNNQEYLFKNCSKIPLIFKFRHYGARRWGGMEKLKKIWLHEFEKQKHLIK